MGTPLRLVQDDTASARLSPGGVAVPTVDPGRLRRAFRQVPAAPAVITTTHRNRPVGLTVTSLRSLSADPALLAFSLTRTVSTWPALADAQQVLVHLLDGRQQHLAERFATSGIDRFADPVRHTVDEHGLPLLEGPSTVLRAEIVARHGFGDADLFVGAVVDVRDDAQTGPAFVYHDGGFRGLATS